MGTPTKRFFLVRSYSVGGYASPWRDYGFIEASSPEEAATNLNTQLIPGKTYRQHRTATFTCDEGQWLLRKSKDQLAYFLQETRQITSAADLE